MPSRENNVGTAAPVSPRPQARSYNNYVEQQRALMLKTQAQLGGPRLWRQMVIGFIFAACIGMVMFVLGAIFISDAIAKKYSITIMLCVMGMVCGLIIVCGTAFLGRVFISRKWRQNRGRTPVNNQPHAACFHTCSVIYTPSQDQLAQVGYADPPPTYDSVLQLAVSPTQDRGAVGLSLPPVGSSGETRAPDVMILPPKYDDVMAPLPSYVE